MPCNKSKTKKCQINKETLCGRWSSLSPMLVARRNFAAASGPDKDATGTAQGLDNDPRVYVIGGFNEEGEVLDQCEKYDPNTDTWSEIASLPKPLANCSGAFVPDYGKTMAINLGYIYVAGGEENILYRYDIKKNEWTIEPELPFAPNSSTLSYLDDVGGPLAQLLILVANIEFPACTDGQTLWSIGGEGTEQEAWFIEVNINGELSGEWHRGPDLPLKRSKPLIGRTFWRDAGITSFGISNCATVVVAGGLAWGKTRI